MASRRIERLNEQIKREITEILRYEAKDPRIGAVTVMDVRTTADLSLARVYVSIMGGEEERAQALEGLRAAAPFIRTELGSRLTVRRVPELRFELDRTLDHAMRIEELLREIRPTSEEGGEAESTEDDEG